VALIVASLCGDGAAAEETTPPDAAAIAFFEKEVRPLLAAKCFECHGPKQQWSSLRLDTREGLLKGGDLGQAVVPGRPEESLLIKAVRHDLDAPSMPPEESGGRLSEREIANLARWIAMGAVFPASAQSIPNDAASPHWAFVPPADPPVPAVNDVSWPR